jgi:hypothetical protein
MDDHALPTCGQPVLDLVRGLAIDVLGRLARLQTLVDPKVWKLVDRNL